MKTIVTPYSLIVSFGISVLVGVIFGLYPARRAAMMDRSSAPARVGPTTACGLRLRTNGGREARPSRTNQFSLV